MVVYLLGVSFLYKCHILLLKWFGSALVIKESVGSRLRLPLDRIFNTCCRINVLIMKIIETRMFGKGMKGDHREH